MGSMVQKAMSPRGSRLAWCLGVVMVLTALIGVSVIASPTPDPVSTGSHDGALADPSVYLPDFSYAGYQNGRSSTPLAQGALIDVTKFGAEPNDGIDDTAAILAALEAANKVDGPVVVQFPVGTLVVSEILPIARGNIVLRGQGSGPAGTELSFPRPLAMVNSGDRFDEIREYLVKYNKRQRQEEENIDYLFSEYSWTGGFIWVQKDGTRAASYLEERDPPIEVLANVTRGMRGEQTIRVDTSGALREGMVVQLQWLNREGENGALIDAIYGDTDLAIGSHHWTFPERPLVRQMTRVTAIDKNTITLSDPLLHDVNAAVPAQMAVWEHLEEVGIEDMRLSFPNAPSFGHHLERGYNGIYFTSVFNGWIRDVTIVNADSGVLSYNSANLTIENIRAEGSRRAHYAVHVGNVHNVLVSDLTIAGPVIHPLTFNTQSTRSVYRRATVLVSPVLDQHAGSNHQNLFDEITVFISAKRDDDGPFYKLWDGSGAPYWQPGHGRFNTTWNMRVVVEDGARRNETVRLLGLAEGPDARLVGIRGNRSFDVEYLPKPYIEALNTTPRFRSLYDWQLQNRLTDASD